MKPIVIDVRVKAGRTTKSLDNLSESLKRVAQGYRQASYAQQQFSRTSNAPALVSQSKGQARQSSLSRVKAPPKAPFDTIEDEIAWLRTQTGWRSQAKADALQKRLDAMRNANNPSHVVMQAMMRTRFSKGIFGGIKGMPLGADILKLGGMSSPIVQAIMGGSGGMARLAPMIAPLITNPVTIAAMVAAAAVVGTTVLGFNAGRVMGKYGSTIAASGGLNGSYRNASIIAGFAGLGSGSDASRRLQESIAGGGLATSYAIKAGINPMGFPFGDMDYATKLAKYTEFVSRSQSFNEARRRAEAVGMPDLAKSYWLSDRDKREMTSIQKQRMSPRWLRDSAKFDYELARLGQGFDEFVMKAGNRFLPQANIAMRGLNKLIDDFGNALDFLNNLPGLSPWGTADWMVNRLGLNKGNGSSEQRRLESEKRHTDAMNDHVRAIKTHIDYVGGGLRTRGAIPSNIQGFNAKEGMEHVRINPN